MLVSDPRYHDLFAGVSRYFKCSWYLHSFFLALLCPADLITFDWFSSKNMLFVIHGNGFVPIIFLLLCLCVLAVCD